MKKKKLNNGTEDARGAPELRRLLGQLVEKPDDSIDVRLFKALASTPPKYIKGWTKTQLREELECGWDRLNATLDKYDKLIGAASLWGSEGPPNINLLHIQSATPEASSYNHRKYNNVPYKLISKFKERYNSTLC